MAERDLGVPGLPPPLRPQIVHKTTISAKSLSRDAELFGGCAADVDQQEEGGGMKVDGGAPAACYDDDTGAAMTMR